MSTIYINREDAGVSVRPSDILEVTVHVTTRSTHVLPFCSGMRLYFDLDSGGPLDDLIDVLIQARDTVVAEANRRWTDEVEEDADSELVGSPKEEAA